MNEEENSTEVVLFSLDGGREWWVLVDGVLGGGFTISCFVFRMKERGDSSSLGSALMEDNPSVIRARTRNGMSDAI